MNKNHDKSQTTQRLSHRELLELQRWNTPTIYNGWEQITSRKATECFSLEPVTDFMPHMGPMIGHAVTMVIEPSTPKHKKANPDAFLEHLRVVAEAPGPKVLVVQDLDKPRMYGCSAGEVFSSIHRALGCVGAVIDGGVRDLDEMCNAGFKVIARQLGVGHAYAHPVRWNCEVEVFGQAIQPGQLVHADKHGFLAIPSEDEAGLLEASRFMDCNECSTVIPAAKFTAGLTCEQVLEQFTKAGADFGNAAKKQFAKGGEW